MAITVPDIATIPADSGFGRGQNTPYRAWVDAQGVPVTLGLSVYDLNELPTEPWGNTGVNMNFVTLPATGEVDDFWVMDIPPGGQFKPMHHMFHMMIYVLKGRGATSVWIEGGKKQTFEWQVGSLFAMPLNAWYEHFNGSGSEMARLCMMTTAPLAINMNPSDEFIFNNSATFPKVFSGQDDYFSAEGKHTGQTMWECNFIADARLHETDSYTQRGAGGTNMHFSFGGSFLQAHISEFDPGTYKKAHRHGPGPHVMLLAGTGYSLAWADKKDKYRIDWKPGTVYVPPNYWFHQHFNPHSEPARYLPFTFPAHLLGRPLAGRTRGQPRELGDQIEYPDEDPWIMEQFEAECTKHGTPLQKERMSKDWEDAHGGPRVDLS